MTWIIFNSVKDFVVFFSPFPEKFGSHWVSDTLYADFPVFIEPVQFFVNMVVLEANGFGVMTR